MKEDVLGNTLASTCSSTDVHSPKVNNDTLYSCSSAEEYIAVSSRRDMGSNCSSNHWLWPPVSSLPAFSTVTPLSRVLLHSSTQESDPSRPPSEVIHYSFTHKVLTRSLVGVGCNEAGVKMGRCMAMWRMWNFHMPKRYFYRFIIF